MSVPLGAEVDDLFLTIGTGFDHLLLTLRGRGAGSVTRHVFLGGHYFLAPFFHEIRAGPFFFLAAEVHIDLVGRQAG